MAEYPKLAIKGRKDFDDLKFSNYSEYVDLKSAGNNTTEMLIESRTKHTSARLKEVNLLTKLCNESISKGREIKLPKMVSKVAKSKMKNKEDILSA